MDDWLSILQAASFVGLLVVTTYAGLQRSQLQNHKESIEGLRGDRDDLKARLEERDKAHHDELTTRDGVLAASEKRITDLEAEVAALRRTVTGEVHWTVIEGLIGDMTRNLADHHAEAMAGVARLEVAQAAHTQALQALTEAIRELREAA